MWVPTEKLPRNPGHPFYEGLNRVLEKAGFDAFVEGPYAWFCAERVGWPSLRLGRYFRRLLVAYFEGLDSERTIAWRGVDSLSVRASWNTNRRKRWRITRVTANSATDRCGHTPGRVRLGVGAIGRGEAVAGAEDRGRRDDAGSKAAMRSVVRRDTGEGYEAFFKRMAVASGVPTPTRSELVRFDRKRKKQRDEQPGVE